MDQLSASELSALELSVADDAEQAEAPLAEAPLTAPPAWASEAAAWTPRGHLTAAQAASARDSAAATFSYIANCATPGAAVELPARYRAVRAGGCAVREGAELTSEPAGRLLAGEEVTVSERRELPAATPTEGTRAVVVRLRTERGWVSELSKKWKPLMIPSPEPPPSAPLAEIVALRSAGTLDASTLVWSPVMLGSFEGWQPLPACQDLLLAAAGIPPPAPQPHPPREPEPEPEPLERTASEARAEFGASMSRGDQVDVLSAFFARVDKTLKGRFRTGTVEAILEDRRGEDGCVSDEE